MTQQNYFLHSYKAHYPKDTETLLRSVYTYRLSRCHRQFIIVPMVMGLFGFRTHSVHQCKFDGDGDRDGADEDGTCKRTLTMNNNQAQLVIVPPQDFPIWMFTEVRLN